MRLLHTYTLEVEMFNEPVPGYAILSHTWDTYEVTLEDMKLLGGREGFLAAVSEKKEPQQSYKKILDSADFARSRGFDYIWIDTCCIDKSSSAELSETINSMFAWYRDAEICYAYLADVSDEETSGDQAMELSKSRWFTRGWTLQELIAPKEVIFVDKYWQFLGTRKSLIPEIRTITGVRESVLDGASLDTIASGAKMAWVSGRNTTRPEDIAYCLFGLFNVSMPLLYGEGKEKAFIRLQEEILKASDDDSIFAWRTTSEESRKKPYWGILAPTPDYFEGCQYFSIPRFSTHRSGQPTMVTNRGVRVELSLAPFRGDASGTIFLAILDCSVSSGRHSSTTAIVVQRLSDLEDQYARIAPEVVVEFGLGIFEPPMSRFTESFKSQMDLLGWAYHGRIDEPKPRYLFVRLNPRQSNLLTGFWIEPMVNGSMVRKKTSQFVVSISDPEQPWEEWGETLAFRYYKIDMGDEDIFEDLDQFEAANLKEKKVLGCMGVSVKLRTVDGADKWTKTIYFVVGLMPLPENPFGTPNGFVKPWYSFAKGKSAASIFKKFKQRVPSEVSEYELLPDNYKMSIDFDIGTRFAKVFYKVNLNIANDK